MTSSNTQSSSLDVVKSRATIDIDQLSPELAQSLGPFCDMTSNQALIAGVVTSDPDSKLVQEVIEEVKKHEVSEEERIELALDLFVSPSLPTWRYLSPSQNRKER